MRPSDVLLRLLFGLPRPVHRRIGVQRDIAVAMSDGVTLLTDRYYPIDNERAPIVLVRTPYGRRGPLTRLYARPLAFQGFQVVIQSCRGTFGSGGCFDAFRNERADGLATHRWLRAQSWFSGDVATMGPSYLGVTQWAVASEAGPALKALAPQVTASALRSSIYPGGSFSLDTALTWIYQVTHQEGARPEVVRAARRARSILTAARLHLPLETADQAVTGRTVSFYQDWLRHEKPGDPWWESVDFSARLGEVTAPAHLIGGWYDIFLPDLLADYQRLRDAGRSPYLTIGPWSHVSLGLIPVAVRESIAWFRAHLLGDRSHLRESPVRVFVMGAGSWRALGRWPPALEGRRWHLQPEGGLSERAPVESKPDRYLYDPSDPTPAVGGSSLSRNSGPRDNRALESREDVLCYTSTRLDAPVEVIGPVGAELYVSSTLAYADFHVRLCDVHPSGASINVCDGLVRLACPDEGITGRKVRVELWATAYRFPRGHRIRVQVSSGAHPRWARNPGTGDPLATAAVLRTAEQTVFHDPLHPSAILLPVH